MGDDAGGPAIDVRDAEVRSDEAVDARAGQRADESRPAPRASDPRSGRFGGPRILVVGCGDVGLRLVARLRDRYRVHALTHSPDRLVALRDAGATPHLADLDDPGSLHCFGSIAPTVVHLAPPPLHGASDPRTAALCGVLRGVRRLVYVSTSGVYGDCGGAWVAETRPVAPQSDRARRRVAAEETLRRWARQTRATLTILRVPGIYAADRLPVARVAAGTPVLVEHDDVYTNHIHADDLAALIVRALDAGAPQRVYHAVDDSAIRMGDWFDLVADAYGHPRPARLPAPSSRRAYRRTSRASCASRAA